MEAGDTLPNSITARSSTSGDQIDDSDPPTSVPVGTFEELTNTVTTRVSRPRLVIDKVAAEPGPLSDGDTVDYTVTVENIGDTTAYAVPVTDTPDPILASVTMGAHAGRLVDGWSPVDPDIGWYLPTLDPGEVATFSYTATVADDVAALVGEGIRTLDNTAVVGPYRPVPLVQGGFELIDDVPPATTSTPLADSGLHLSKHPSAACTGAARAVQQGETVTWCVVADNAGPATAYGAEITEQLPLGVTYVPSSGVPTPTSVSSTPAGERLSWAIGDLAPGSRQVRFDTIVDTTSSGHLVNTATITSTRRDGTAYGAANFAATRTAHAAVIVADSDQQIAKTPDVQVVEAAGGPVEVSWTITVTNPGDTPLTGLVVTDDMPSVPTAMSFVRATTSYPGGPASEVVASGPGSDRVVWTFPTLPPGDSFVIEVTGSVDPADLAAVDRTDPSTYTWVNTASLVSDQIPESVENQAKAVLDLDASPTLHKTVACGGGHALRCRFGTPPEVLVYTVTVTNDESEPLWDLTVRDVPDSDHLDVRDMLATAGSAALDGDGASVVWTIPGPLAPGATATLTYTTSTGSSADWPLVNSASWGDGRDLVNTVVELDAPADRPDALPRTGGSGLGGLLHTAAGLLAAGLLLAAMAARRRGYVASHGFARR